MKIFLLLIIFYSDVNLSTGKTIGHSSWSMTGNYDYLFPSSISREKVPSSSCRHCFNVRTWDGGRRMTIEPCGGPDCISMVNNTELQEDDQPTEKYDLDQCGVIKDGRSIVKKALQLKISTGVKNTLRPAEYPWLVRIESRSTFFSSTVTLCGGTLIHPQWIITAAHCMFDSKTNRLYPANGIDLHLGHYDRLTSSKDEYITQPSSYFVHPQFRISRISPAPVHDLALIKLARPVPISSSIDIACLPESTDQLRDGTLAYTAGWGHSSPSSTAVNKPRKARLRISPRSCQLLMVDSYLHICGRSERGSNICSGDSGTGLMVRAGVSNKVNQTDWKWHLFGVASYGLDECSRNVNHDNAFASVSIDVNWIHRMMNHF